MTDVNRVKRVIAAVGLLLAAAVGAVVLRQAANALLSAASGADPTSIFNDTPPAPAEVRTGIIWLPDANDGRVMEPTTRDAITDAYARALAAVDRAGRGDAATPLADYFSGPALEAALDASTDSTVTVATLFVEQSLRLDFYSDDGSVVAIGVPSVDVVRVVDTPDRQRSVVTSSEERRIVMILQDGNWRVEQVETVDVTPLEPPGERVALDGPIDGVNALSAQSDDPTWAAFDRDVAIGELELAADLGFDSVRVFVAGPEFGAVDLDAVAEFLDLAAERGIGVVVTLFDGSADHSVPGWRDDEAYLDDVVGRLADHPAIVLWDLKNEPDLDDERSGGAAITDAWLERVSSLVAAIDPDTPRTVGWSSVEHARRALRVLDVVSFHHFDSPAALAAGLAGLEADAVERPVFVGEYGRPEWIGWIRGAQPAAQARDIAAMRTVLADAGVSAAMWELRDPPAGREAGPIAGRASGTYGAVRTDGERRPLANVIRDRDAVVDPGTVERVRSWAPTVLPVVAIASIATGAWVLWRRRRRQIDSADLTAS